MDIQTKDGITLRGIPDGTPDEAIKERIAKIRAEGAQREPFSAPPASEPAPQTRATAKPKSFWDVAKQEAAPDIFNTSGASYDLGGKVTDALAPHVPDEVAAGAGYVSNVVGQALPVIVGAFGGSAAGKPAMEGAARGVMQSAIKPSVANLEKGKVAAAVETMLEGGYSPTNSGVSAMRSKIDSLVANADKVIAPSNKLVDVSRAMQNVSGVADKARTATMGLRDADTAIDVSKSLAAHPAVDNLGLMSVQSAQAMKQANYKALGDAAYGMGLKPAAERDAIKAVTAALKTNIERAEPAVAPINAKISELVNAVKVSQRRALIEGNKDIIPLGASIATAVSNPVAALGLYANSSAAVKAILARAMYSGAKGVPAAVGGSVGAAVGAESGREDAGPQQRAIQAALIARAITEQQERD